jgi:hypothetical protein
MQTTRTVTLNAEEDKHHHKEAEAVLDKINRGATELDIAQEHFAFWLVYRVSIERYMRLRVAAPKRPYVRRTPVNPRPESATILINGNGTCNNKDDSSEEEYRVKYKRIKT